jgi:hypothetical protein
MRLALAILGIGVALAPRPLAAQRDSVLAHRWVGIHLGRSLQLEFYDDTMLVVNDDHVLDFRLTNDSLVGFGDTTVTGRYRLVRIPDSEATAGPDSLREWLLLETPDGVVTMAEQKLLARPLTGRWRGPLGTEDGVEVELVISIAGTARWRRLPGGPWQDGEWDRDMRTITFTWNDESEWQALYDPIGNALLFETTIPESAPTILHKIFR